MFQNCSGLEEAGVTEADSTTAEVKNPEIFGSNNPFPFKLDVNHLAYMSCNNLRANNEAYFTFRMSTFKNNQLDNVGLRISSEFLERTKNFESDSYRIGKLKESLPIEGIKLQFSLNNLENYIPTSLTTDAASNNFFPPLESDVVMNKIFENTSQASHLLEGVKSISQRHIASTLYFNQLSDQDSANIRNALSPNGSGQTERNILAVSYTIPEGGDGYLLGSHGIVEPENTNSKPYGKAFQIDFSNDKTMRSIKEFNLNDSSRREQGSWTCAGSATAKLRVVRYEDAGSDLNKGQFCPRANTGLDLTQANHRAIANILKLEHWYINMRQGCITPKKASVTGATCYGTQNPNIEIDYLGNVVGPLCGTAQGVFNGKTYLCPQYVTVCSKQVD